jgi:hypothetical protein
MKRKFFLAMTMLAITGALLLTTLAQDKIKITNPNALNLTHKVTLKCLPDNGGPVQNTYLLVSNPTAQDIPPVSTIYITTATKYGTSPVSKTSNPLALKANQGNWIDVYNPLKGTPASQCEAWTFVK